MIIKAEKIKLLLLNILFILFVSTNSFAQDFIKAEVDKTSITTDDILTYKITIASTERKLPGPKLPDFKGFIVESIAQSSSMSLVKNEINTTLVYAFILGPMDTGKFKIEPSQIKLQGKIYSTESFEVEVTKGKAQPKPKPEQKPPLPQEAQPETEEPQITL